MTFAEQFSAAGPAPDIQKQTPRPNARIASNGEDPRSAQTGPRRYGPKWVSSVPHPECFEQSDRPCLDPASSSASPVRELRRSENLAASAFWFLSVRNSTHFDRRPAALPAIWFSSSTSWALARAISWIILSRISASDASSPKSRTTSEHVLVAGFLEVGLDHLPGVGRASSPFPSSRQPRVPAGGCDAPPPGTASPNRERSGSQRRSCDLRSWSCISPDDDNS